MELASSQSYANFRAWVPRNILPIGVHHPTPWLYYDWGPRTYPEPLVCLHSLIGSAESFYPQIISLAPRGYRVLSIQIPAYRTVPEFCDAFHSFLDTIHIKRIHFYGAGLGGFLAMQYAVRKPERVSSIVLTHSFLNTSNLNLRIPYSAALLQWLPDFLVRATMRAILPKGRVSLDMANAAEFAIGHTMCLSRDMLAARLALCVTESSVISRLHIPENRITLIDSLDRPSSSAVELSKTTAELLKNSRRALLKTGGDFPYLSVPDDVNVHLIVHLRRTAPLPEAVLEVPPPARPTPLPKSVVKRRISQNLSGHTPTNSTESDLNPDANNVGRSKEELENEAKAVLAEEEEMLISKFTIEIEKLREFLPSRNDAYLAEVVHQCDGDLDLAISRALNDEFDDELYEKAAEQHLQRIVDELQQQDEKEQGQMNNQTDQDGGDFSPPRSDKSISPKSGFKEQRSNVLIDPVVHGEGSTVVTGDLSGTFKTARMGGSISEGHIDRDEDIAEELTTATLDASEEEDGEENCESGTEANADGSVLSSVDVRGGQMFKRREDSESAPTRRESGQTEDAVEKYVSSEKVGMRSHGPMVGRGPAPFNNSETSLTPGETWLRTPRKAEEDLVQVRDKSHASQASGASLLAEDKNPLELPEAERLFSSPQMQVGSFESVGGTGQRRWSGNRSEQWKEGDTAGVAQQGSVTKDSGFSVSERESVEGSGAVTEVEHDEWETFRGVEEAGKDDGESGSEESARLREWQMSAVAASKIVHQ